MRGAKRENGFFSFEKAVEQLRSSKKHGFLERFVKSKSVKFLSLVILGKKSIEKNRQNEL